MNRNLLLTHAHLEMAIKCAEQANESVYLDTLLTECSEVMDAYNSLMDALDSIKANAITDIVDEAKGYTRRAKIVHYDFTGRTIIKEA